MNLPEINGICENKFGVREYLQSQKIVYSEEGPMLGASAAKDLLASLLLM